jgi:hypothetical protein
LTGRPARSGFNAGLRQGGFRFLIPAFRRFIDGNDLQMSPTGNPLVDAEYSIP